MVGRAFVAHRALADDQLAHRQVWLQAAGRADAHEPPAAQRHQLLQDGDGDRRADAEAAAHRQRGIVCQPVEVGAQYAVHRFEPVDVAELCDHRGLIAEDRPLGRRFTRPQPSLVEVGDVGCGLHERRLTMLSPVLRKARLTDGFIPSACAHTSPSQ
jgi:hypothetical protein